MHSQRQLIYKNDVTFSLNYVTLWSNNSPNFVTQRGSPLKIINHGY